MRRYTSSFMMSRHNLMPSYSKDIEMLQRSGGSDKQRSQWEVLMRKFSDDCKANDLTRICLHALETMTCEKRALQHFPTGSMYNGTWDIFGMSGYGIYTYPNGAIYEGEFEDNMFHGRGVLKYPGGMAIKGQWVNGELHNFTVVYDDEIKYNEKDWSYCKMPDRRFAIELNVGLQPAGRSFQTAEQPPREIPHGFYDTGDGFFDPNTNAVYDYTNQNRICRMENKKTREWIMKNCRKSQPLEPIGPQPELYEHWVQPSENYSAPSSAQDVLHTNTESKHTQNSGTMVRSAQSEDMSHQQQSKIFTSVSFARPE